MRTQANINRLTSEETNVAKSVTAWLRSVAYTRFAGLRGAVAAVIMLICIPCIYGKYPKGMGTAAIMERARQAAEAGDYSGSSRMYRKALEAGGDSLVCLQSQTENAMRMGDYVSVIELLPQLRGVGGEMAYTYNYEAQANTALGNVDSAANIVVVLVSMVGIDNDSYEAMTTVADADLGVMADRFRAEKRIDADNPLWDECLGTIFAYARLYDKAVEAYLSALKLDPKSDADHESLALLYNQMRNYESALYYATKAVELNPDYPHYVSNKALIERNSGMVPQAIATLTTAMNDTASYAPYLTTRGMLLASAGKYREAIADYDTALALDSVSAPTLLRKGIALSRLGEKAQAMDVFRKVVGLGYDHWSGTALAQAYLGNQKAVDEYIVYATAQRRRTDNYFSLAAICDVSGHAQEALRYIEMALEENSLNPDVIQYDQSLERVKHLSGYKELMAKYGAAE